VNEPLRLPQQLLLELRAVPGFDEGAFLAAHSLPPPVSVRLHPLKGAGLWPQALRVPWCPEGRYLPERPLFTADPLFHAGAYYVQEASSMLLHHLWQHIMAPLSGPQWGLRVLDLSAAPGGKSTLLASLLDERSLLIANDVIRSRATILDESMTRWGYTNTWVTSNDPRDFGRMPGYFDAMLVDAPCSGSGLFRKDPRALNEWSGDAVQLCAARQQRILADAWPSLKEGGVLFYATCSYSPAEDEAILDWLGGQYDVETLEAPMAEGWGVVTVRSPKKGLAGYRCFPDKLGGEGFFIAALRKQEAATPFYYPRFRAAHMRKAEEASRHLLRPGPFTILEDDRRAAIAIAPWHEPDYHFLREIVYLRKGGIRLGTASQKDWIPEHDVALSLDRRPGLPQWALSREEALRFLKKEELAPPPGLPRGWQVASFEGRGLGWVKVLSNRVNNYLPKSWRIRMELPDEALDNWAE
jgi:16S rRNA C967 or C1407 C5-methylase (RsmB/RsmF family)/NOL1/NOP2/fmu family ribosome biogenesis protein